jgi:hypothetical protein
MTFTFDQDDRNWLELDRVVAGGFPAGTGVKLAKAPHHRQWQAMEGRFDALKCRKQRMNGFGIKIGRQARLQN